MIEAMACGTPVIAYRSGSVPEVIEDGVTGFIVDGEEEAIRAVRELGRVSTDGLSAPVSRSASPHVRMAREYEARYRELVAERVKPRRASSRQRPNEKDSTCGLRE